MNLPILRCPLAERERRRSGTVAAPWHDGGASITKDVGDVGRRQHEVQHLPVVGEVYMAHTIVFANGDHAEDRPIVVVRAPRRRWTTSP
jgi:hypothetical protein